MGADVVTAREAYPRPPWRPAGRPLVVVSPHPDDATLLFGGLVAAHARRGLPVTIVAVTDGEGGHPLHDGTDLAERRRAEQARAVARLTRRTAGVVRLGLPDGRVSRHVSTLSDALRDVIDVATTGPGDDDVIVAVPSPLDHHADHVACAAAADRLRGSCTLVHGFFWAYHTDPHALAGRPLRRLDLDLGSRLRRAHALAAHRTQVTGRHAPRLLGREELRPVRRRFELYEVDPA